MITAGRNRSATRDRIPGDIPPFAIAHFLSP
jgi:hypothetical protein